MPLIDSFSRNSGGLIFMLVSSLANLFYWETFWLSTAPTFFLSFLGTWLALTVCIILSALDRPQVSSHCQCNV